MKKKQIKINKRPKIVRNIKYGKIIVMFNKNIKVKTNTLDSIITQLNKCTQDYTLFPPLKYGQTRKGILMRMGGGKGKIKYNVYTLKQGHIWIILNNNHVVKSFFTKLKFPYITILYS